VSLLGGGKSPFHDDDGSADPRAAATLAAFGSGLGSEHAALTALAASRLLVPIVAAPPDGTAHDQHAGAGAGDHRADGGDHRADGGDHRADGGDHRAGEGDHGAEMSLPTLIGRDGRAAIPAFTSLDTLARWDPNARPVPALATSVWRAAVDSSSAVVVDVAGPVPLAVEGARLVALADGQPVPLPHQDPDVLAAVRAAASGEPAIAGLRLVAGTDPAPEDNPGDGRAPSVGSDLQVELTLVGGCAAAAGEEAARRLGNDLMNQLGERLRRGITIAVTGSDRHGRS
jgi:SseB protein N-terminal domain